MEQRRLRLPGIGDVKINFHRPLRGIPKAITVKREGAKWWVSMRCIDVPAEPLEPVSREVGLDLGVTNRVATSDGEFISADVIGPSIESRLADAQRACARSVAGSNRGRRRVERVQLLHRKISNKRRNSAHQISRRLVNEFDYIVVEDLDILNMVRSRRRRSHQAESGVFPSNAVYLRRLHYLIYDAGWGTLLSLLLYKAESAGRVVVLVDPRYTSLTCAECGHVERLNRVNQATFRCQSCGHCDHADTNAARNILRAGRAQQATTCVG